MGKQTRRGFLAATGAATVVALTGCAAGAPPDSTYQGTYRSVYAIPGVGETGTFNYSVEKKGKINGSFVDSSTGKVYAFAGTVGNDGKFAGQLADGASSSPVLGTLSPSGGNFSLTRSGKSLQGDFEVGGTITQGQSDYQGIYSGVYGVDTSLKVDGVSLNGLASYSVDSKGNIIGSLTHGAETGLLTGTIGNTGAFQATVKFVSGALPLSGTLVKTADGSAQGNFTVSSGGQLYPASLSKSTSVVAGGDSPYKGSYRGTYGIPDQGENGNLSFTIDPSGSIVGFFNQALNKPVGTFVGSVENDGGFSGQITFNAKEVAALAAAEQPLYATRTIQGKIGTRIGGSGASGDFTMVINGTVSAGNFEATVGGSEVDSNYRAAYVSNAALAPCFDAGLETTGTFFSGARIDLAVDKQGSIIGSLGSYRFDARVTNDGRVVGLLYQTSSTPYAIRGILSKVVWKIPNASGTSDDVPGIAGNLYVTINKVEYPLSIRGTGGDGITK